MTNFFIYLLSTVYLNFCLIFNFSGNMNKINNMRARLLYNKFYLNKGHTNVELTFDGMVAEVLKIPSYTETGCCTKSVKSFTFLGLNNDVFQNDLSNMQEAIDDNLIEIPICNQCKKKPKFKREFGNHLFVNVRLIFINKNIIHSNQGN